MIPKQVLIPEKVENYIRHFANRYRNLPDIILSYEDLIQEGRLVVLECMLSYDADRGGSFDTYCYSCLRTWFNNHGRGVAAATRMRGLATASIVADHSHSEYGRTSPERWAMFAEALSSLQVVCKPVAEIILEGIGDDFYLILKDDLKQKSIRNKWSTVSSRIRLTKKLLIEYLGLTQKDLHEVIQILKLFV